MMTGSDDSEPTDKQLEALLAPRFDWMIRDMVERGIEPWVVDVDKELKDTLHYIAMYDYDTPEFDDIWVEFMGRCVAFQIKHNQRKPQ